MNSDSKKKLIHFSILVLSILSMFVFALGVLLIKPFKDTSYEHAVVVFGGTFIFIVSKILYVRIFRAFGLEVSMLELAVPTYTKLVDRSWSWKMWLVVILGSIGVIGFTIFAMKAGWF